MSPADAGRLREVLRRESRSLLQYARGASPYAAATDRKLLDGVRRVADEDTAALADFGEFLGARRVAPAYLGSFPVAFTDLNYVGVRFLLPKLVAEQQRDLATLEADADATADRAAQEAIRQLAELGRRHLKELESLG